MRRMMLVGFLVAAGAAVPALPGTAAEYPVSGRWSYQQQTENGPSCSGPTMEFNGNRRLDSGGSSAPDYRNLSVDQIDRSVYKVVDTMFTGPVQGQVSYTLRVLDDDHIEMDLQPSRGVVTLERCK
jgi:hypothetical protein